MKVLFDASDLCAAHADGTTRYTAELMRRFPELPADGYEWVWGAQCNQPNVAGVDVPRHTRWIGRDWQRYWTQTRLPLDLLKERPDVLFMPIQQLPILRPPNIKTVAVVHDLAFFEFPEQFTYKNWLLLQIFSAQAVREADALIAVSESTKQDIEKYYGRSQGVHMVHHGVNHGQFYKPPPDERARAWKQIEKKYPDVRRPYMLYVGQIQPRKNLERLVAAFEEIWGGDKDLQLIIAGGHGWLQDPILNRAKESGAAGSIHMLGRVPDELLAPLYWHAEAFVLPSLYEGFGMPILEAMASGCPVVTSNGSSMSEVAGGAAVLVNPLDVKSIAAGMRDARRRREGLANSGLARAKEFTWGRCAEQTLAVIEGLR